VIGELEARFGRDGYTLITVDTLITEDIPHLDMMFVLDRSDGNM